MRALLDINVLIALFDPDHVHHARAWSWFERQSPMGWASCPITQNGCLRVMSQPAYPNPLPVAALVERLASACAAPEHQFWPDDTSLLDTASFDHARIHGHRQISDLYLLGLAIAHDGCFATFDQTIALSAARNARPGHLIVV